MSLEAEVNTDPAAVQRIAAVARRTSGPAFADIQWPPCPHVLALMDDPGVMFESPRRVVVFQRIGGELRYYAGGWCPDQSRIYLEQERVWAEGSESGVFRSVADALAFAEQYLAEERSFAGVGVPREVRWSRYPEVAEAEPGAAPDRGRM
jgi:hypothetical protein